MLLISSSRKALRWRDSRNSQRGPCASNTQLDSLKSWCPRRWQKPNAMRNRGYCEVAVECAHTKSLDANDKLIQTRSHVRDTTASRKRQVIMRKVKSTILRNVASPVDQDAPAQRVHIHAKRDYLLSGLYPLTTLAWVTLLGALFPPVQL